MRTKLILSALGAGLLLVGAGCSASNNTAVDNQANVESDNNAGSNSTAPTAASLEVKNDTLANNKFIINRVNATENSWVVIHAVVNGQPDMVLGETAVSAGTTNNVEVTVDPKLVTAQVVAMLHTDAGVAGTYEYPGADMPTKDASGAVVMVLFDVSNFASVQADLRAKIMASSTAPNAKVKVQAGTNVKITVPPVKAY